MTLTLACQNIVFVVSKLWSGEPWTDFISLLWSAVSRSESLLVYLLQFMASLSINKAAVFILLSPLTTCLYVSVCLTFIPHCLSYCDEMHPISFAALTVINKLCL